LTGVWAKLVLLNDVRQHGVPPFEAETTGRPSPLKSLGKTTLNVSANDLMWTFCQRHPLSIGGEIGDRS
jgi:hypothetical protein